MTLNVITTANSPYFFVLPQTDGRIVFHYGVPGPLPKDQDPKQPVVLPPYQVTITDQNGVTVFQTTVPDHWWNARWTYYPSKVAVTRSPADLVAARRMFAYGDTGLKLPTQGTTPPYTIMGSSNIVIGMPTTGERPDIGLVTDNSAWYMLGKNPDGMIQWGYCGNTCPMHFRDPATGLPINLLNYVTANAYSKPGYQGSPWLARGVLQANGYNKYGGGWEPQQAHYCEMSYVAYQATGNPSFLEDLQYSANFTVLCDAAKSYFQKVAVVSGEYRGVAWALRNLFMAHVSTLDAEKAGALPDTCHTSGYFKTLLDQSLAFYSKSITDPTRQTFRIVAGLVNAGSPPKPAMAPWQMDYMLSALAFGVLTGHSDWTPLYLWALKNVIDRTSGQSGYPPGWGGAYYLDASQLDWKSAWRAGIPGLGGAEPPTAQEIAILTADPLNHGVAMNGQEYLIGTRAVLVMADYLDKLGLAKVRATYPELDQCLQICGAMNKSYGLMKPRQSVVAGAAPSVTVAISGVHLS